MVLAQGSVCLRQCLLKVVFAQGSVCSRQCLFKAVFGDGLSLKVMKVDCTGLRTF